MQFIKITTEDGIETIINTKYIVRLVGKDDNYQIDLVDDYTVALLSKEEYDRVKQELGIDPLPAGFAEKFAKPSPFLEG